MKRAKIIDQMIEEKFESRRQFAEMVGIPPTTLQSILKRGIGKASVDNVIKICKGLGITVEELEIAAQTTEGPPTTDDIAKIFQMSVDELLKKSETKDLSEKEKSFIANAKKLSLEDLKDKFIFTVDGKQATYEEIRTAIAFIRSVKDSEESK